MMRRTALTLLLVIGAVTRPSTVLAHSGPPYPVVENRVAGPYRLSVWTDPDTTDDHSPAGKFWVTVDRADKSGAVPPATRATVTAHATDRSEPDVRAATRPVRGDIANQFAAVVLDHEGPYAVRVDVHGPLGDATVDTAVDATYDLRPARWLIVVYLVPFLLAAFLWTKLLLRRRAATRHP